MPAIFSIHRRGRRAGKIYRAKKLAKLKEKQLNPKPRSRYSLSRRCSCVYTIPSD